MNEQQFVTAQLNKEVTQVGQPDMPVPAGKNQLEKDLETYLPDLEDLRTGRAVAGKLLLSGTQSFSSHASNGTKINLNVADISMRVIADTVNHRLRVTTPGYYHICGAAMFQYSTDGANFQSWIYKNGSSLVSSQAAPGATGVLLPVPVSTIARLNGGDYLELYGRYSAGSSIVDDQLNMTYLYIIKL